MVLDSSSNALGSHAPDIRDIVVKVVRSRHDRSAAAHEQADTRYGMGFGSQWRDLLDDVVEALTERGFGSHPLTPAGYRIPVVNDCLVYVWRVPNVGDAVEQFASSPTRRNGFTASPPDPMLFEPGFVEQVEQGDNASEEEAGVKLSRALREVGDTMPLVLVTVQSSPRGLQSIDWATAVLDDAGKVELHGQERIWGAEPNVDSAAPNAESFDSGMPTAPAVELQKQEGARPDVR